ncbi:GGDEF domain-containing protein [Nocardia sp. NBC_01327]|uniref:GGDEF domain-containing protein n=1 Tax=Nocardia sp. NBC_01327 TaxID=2903593 RepID=UPI002E140394|nr:GGDEF domain-containing protein [Nocardia sp. NBC_01327]
MGSSAGLLKSWWRDPIDRRWLVHVLESHSVLRWEQWSVGAGGLVMAFVAAATAASPSGPSDTSGRVIFAIIGIGALLWALRWWFGPWPSAKESLILFAAADVSITVGCLQDSNRVYGSLGVILLVVTGSYLTFFHSPKVLAAHALWSVLSVLVLSWHMVTGGGDIFLATAIVLIVMAALVVALPSLQFMFWLVQTESMSDPLTKLINRRGLEFHLSRMFATSDLARICVMIVDLDGFKSVNDRFGHSVGDDVLMRTAQRIQAAATPDLIVSRTGGEEFAVVGLMSAEEAGAAAELFRQSAAAQHTVPVTVSIGVAIGGDGPHPTPQVLLQRADSAMYQAKHDGGNRVVIDEAIRPEARRG